MGLRVIIETKVGEDVSTPVRGRQKSPHRWHAVMIAVSAGACAAAQACKGKRFLSGDAPRLPLAGCDATRCDCKYRHFVDRRGAPRRQDEKIAAPPGRADANRRIRRGRRAAD
jgi:hypothetical protein